MPEFQNITFKYPGSQTPTIENLSFRVKDGELVSLIGASGSGKTTLFRLLNGLENPDFGRILVHGKDVKDLKNVAAYMPQQDLLFPWYTVEKNVMLPMEIKHVSKEEQREKAKEMLTRVGLWEYAERYPRELSGGMRQRVSFARTLCAGGELLLLDEPFSALDSITRISMQEWLRSQWEMLDKTILFITHDVEEAIFLSNRVLVLTGKPASQLLEFEIPLPEQRDRQMMLLSEIQALKLELTELLRKEADV